MNLRRILAPATGLLVLLTTACTQPEHPGHAATAFDVPAPRAVPTLPVARAWQRAGQWAAGYGLVVGLGRDVEATVGTHWWRAWPSDPAWTALMPGRIPGLRGWLRRDSLDAYTHGDQATHYQFHLRYPAFVGPRATDSLRRAVLRRDGQPTSVAQLRRGPLYDAPEPAARRQGGRRGEKAAPPGRVNTPGPGPA